MFTSPSIPELAASKIETPLWQTLALPADVEVKDATIVPAVLTDVWGTDGSTHSGHTTHYYYNVHAVLRRTGDDVLLLYESNDPAPPRLLRILRLQPSPDVQLPGTR